MRQTSVVRKSPKKYWSIIHENREYTILDKKVIEKLSKKNVKIDKWYDIIYTTKQNKEEPWNFIKEIKYVSEN